jgi:hypothetical protein
MASTVLASCPESWNTQGIVINSERPRFLIVTELKKSGLSIARKARRSGGGPAVAGTSFGADVTVMAFVVADVRLSLVTASV